MNDIYLGISSFRVDDQDYMVSGCEDRSSKILDTNTGKADLSVFSFRIL